MIKPRREVKVILCKGFLCMADAKEEVQEGDSIILLGIPAKRMPKDPIVLCETTKEEVEDYLKGNYQMDGLPCILADRLWEGLSYMTEDKKIQGIMRLTMEKDITSDNCNESCGMANGCELYADIRLLLTRLLDYGIISQKNLNNIDAGMIDWLLYGA